MAVYKVPQDVEAEDKLLGPFSFRQFVYLMIAAGAGVAMFFLGRLSIFLAAIPLPIFLAFGILALPLRKDQPMETYIAAIIRFYLKPHKRFWQPDGTTSLIEITNPKIDEGPQLKEFGGQEAANRLSFLSQVVDTQGWSTRGVDAPLAGTSLQDEIANDAYATQDILDDSGAIAQSFNQMISQSDQQQRNEILQRMQQTIVASNQPVAQPAPQQQTTTQPVISQATPPADDSQYFVQYSPYPSSMHQSTIQPAGATPQTPPTAQPEPVQPSQPEPTQTITETATEQPSPDIIRLASNNDLSVAAIAREAERLSDKDDEVVISLR